MVGAPPLGGASPATPPKGGAPDSLFSESAVRRIGFLICGHIFCQFGACYIPSERS